MFLTPPGNAQFNQSKFVKTLQVRSPRPGEEDGKAYNFVTKTVMEAAIDNGDFIEFATFADNMYGTSKKAVKTVMDKGEIFQFQFQFQFLFSLLELLLYFQSKVIRTEKCNQGRFWLIKLFWGKL